MPEPVIIFGPAGGPAGPGTEPVRSATAGNEPADAGKADPAPAPTEPTATAGAIGGLARWLIQTSARIIWSAIIAGAHIAGRYPRHSLAAAVSVLILGGIWVLEHRSGKSERPPVPSQISGSPTASGNVPANSTKPGHSPAAPAVGAVARGAPSGTAKPGARPAAPPKTSASLSVKPAAKGDEPAPSSLVTLASTGGPESSAARKTGSAGIDAPAPAPALEPSSRNQEETPSAAALAEPPLKPATDATTKGEIGIESPAPPPESLAPAPSSTLAQSVGPPADLPPPTAGPPAPLVSPGGLPVDEIKGLIPHPVSSSTDDANGGQKSAETVAHRADGTGDDKPPPPSATPPEVPSTNEDHPVPPAGPATHDSDKSRNKKSGSETAKSEPSKLDEPPSDLPSAPPAVDITVPVPSPADTHPVTPSPAGEAAAGDKKAPVAEPGNSPPPTVDTPIPGSQPADRPTASPVAAERPAGPADSGGNRSAMAAGRDAVPDDTSPDSPTVRPTAPSSREPVPSGGAAPDAADAGWVVISNSGRVPTDGTDNLEPDSSDGGPELGGARRSRGASDVRGHAAKGLSVDVPLLESRTRGQRGTDPAALKSELAAGSVIEPPAKLSAVSARVESVPHVVERDENFWTISRLYYSSGRYYKALWKANADKYPEINLLHVGDVIIVPPVEDLDPAYFVTARTKADSPPARRRTDPDQAKQVDAATGSTESPLSLSAVRRVSRQDRAEQRDDSGATDTDQDRALPEIPPDPRPRNRTNPSSTAIRLTYKVRPYDTLRSIARDTVGDASRAAEILELNRELIGDPAQLTPDLVLTLPDDARTGRAQSSSRR
jgi:nucleoid-associated protein YgaU